MKYVLLVVAALIAVVLVVVVTGALLPQDHVARRRITLKQSPETVFALITNVSKAPEWRPDVKSVELLGEQAGRLRYVERSGGDEIPFEVIESEAPRRHVTKIVGEDLPFGGTWTYELEPTKDGGTTLTVTERGEVYNPLFRFMSKYVFGHTATIDAYLKAVGARFGESVTPEDA